MNVELSVIFISFNIANRRRHACGSSVVANEVVLNHDRADDNDGCDADCPDDSGRAFSETSVDLLTLVRQAWNIELHRNSAMEPTYCTLRAPPLCINGTLGDGAVLHIESTGRVEMTIATGSVPAALALARRLQAMLMACLANSPHGVSRGSLVREAECKKAQTMQAEQEALLQFMCRNRGVAGAASTVDTDAEQGNTDEENADAKDSNAESRKRDLSTLTAGNDRAKRAREYDTHRGIPRACALPTSEQICRDEPQVIFFNAVLRPCAAEIHQLRLRHHLQRDSSHDRATARSIVPSSLSTLMHANYARPLCMHAHPSVPSSHRWHEQQQKQPSAPASFARTSLVDKLRINITSEETMQWLDAYLSGKQLDGKSAMPGGATSRQQDEVDVRHDAHMRKMTERNGVDDSGSSDHASVGPDRTLEKDARNGSSTNPATAQMCGSSCAADAQKEDAFALYTRLQQGQLQRFLVSFGVRRLLNRAGVQVTMRWRRDRGVHCVASTRQKSVQRAAPSLPALCTQDPMDRHSIPSPDANRHAEMLACARVDLMSSSVSPERLLSKRDDEGGGDAAISSTVAAAIPSRDACEEEKVSCVVFETGVVQMTAVSMSTLRGVVQCVLLPLLLCRADVTT